MNYKFSVLSNETLEAIIYGMEDQQEEYLLDLNTGVVLPQIEVKASLDSGENYVYLPSWTASDGFQLMISFTQSLKNKDLKEKLSKILNSKERGKFHRFRKALEEDNMVETFHYYKKNKMRVVIRKWLKEEIGLSESTENPLEESLMGYLLDEYEIEVRDFDSSYELPINEPIIEKAFFSLETKKVMEAKKEGKLYGCLYFGYDKSFVLVSHYETEEQELLNLMVDLLCREMGRKHINRVYIVNQREKTDLTSVFDDGELEVKNSNLLSFCTSKWNESRESEEICYVF